VFENIFNKTFPDKKNFLNEIVKLFYFSKKIKEISKKYNIDVIWSHAEYANFATILSKIIFKNNLKII
jgi:hypothetical protein